MRHVSPQREGYFLYKRGCAWRQQQTGPGDSIPCCNNHDHHASPTRTLDARISFTLPSASTVRACPAGISLWRQDGRNAQTSTKRCGCGWREAPRVRLRPAGKRQFRGWEATGRRGRGLGGGRKMSPFLISRRLLPYLGHGTWYIAGTRSTTFPLLGPESKTSR